MIKVSFDLDHTDWHGHPAETLWADPIPMLGPYALRLQNSPFFKRGIAYRDIVDTAPTEGEELFDFKRVIRRGGHSTYMILVSEDEPRFQQHWNDLQALGCTYEWGRKKFSIGHRRFYSVDVPPSADLNKVVTIFGTRTWRRGLDVSGRISAPSMSFDVRIANDPRAPSWRRSRTGK